MRIHWGGGIAGVFVLFVIAVLAMVYMAMKKDVDLVSDQYYIREIHYQDQINAIRRTQALDVQPVIAATAGDIAVRFPSRFFGTHVTGQVVLYRPSDSHKDLMFPLVLDSALSQHIPTQRLLPGFWKVQVSWQHEGAEYYSELPVMVN